MSTFSTLSEDLQAEIILRNSVKSIIQSKCVCKLWHKLITAPRFPELHLSHSNTRNPIILLLSDLYRKFNSIDSNSFTETLTLNPNLPHVAGISIVGSCNGLICLSDMKTVLFIWNPATNECVELPFDQVPTAEVRKRWSVVLGFGYDSVTDEYKVVRVMFNFDIRRIIEFDTCEVKVYTLGSNSWRELTGSPPPCFVGNLTRVAHVNGLLHWIGMREMGIKAVRSIVCFDIRDEKFREVSWPDFDGTDSRDIRLGVLYGCLSVFYYFIDHVEVWVMKNYGVNESWTRLFSILRVTRFLEPLAVQRNGEIVLQRGHRSLVLYDPVSQSTRTPSIYGMPDRFRSGTYVESLISIASIMGNNEDEKQE